jgi:hypothetical protein
MLWSILFRIGCMHDFFEGCFRFAAFRSEFSFHMSLEFGLFSRIYLKKECIKSCENFRCEGS